MAERVLVVDDTPVNQKVLATILKRDGLEAVVAADGTQALDVARREPFDLVLLDVMMPGIDGFAVCALLKADPRTAEIPVVFLSAMGEVQDKVKGLSLGAADYVTKPFENAEVLARVHTQLRLRRLNQSLVRANRELLEKKQALEEDLRAAADIQRALIPRSPLRVPGLDIAWLFEPCLSIGGDIFNVVPLDERHVSFYVLDVSGHGVPPAMVSVLVSQSLLPTSGIVVRRADGNSASCPSPPVDVLRELDREYPLSRFERYFTISYLVLDLASGLLRYSSAGHPPPALLSRDGRLRLLEEGGAIIGLGDDRFDPGEAAMAAGDRLFLYTDGIPDHEDADHRPFGVQRFHEALAASRGAPLAEVCAAVRQALRDFGGGEPHDDISLLAVEYRGAP
jgi:sigma-B regulation protein RsbU (phosphoserine phosphatase)